MFTFNAFGSGVPPANSTSGGVLGTAAPPAYPRQRHDTAAPPVFGSAAPKGSSGSSRQGAAVPLTATPVFGGSGGNMFSTPSAPILPSTGLAAETPSAPSPSTALPLPPPSVYSSAAPTTAAPVFGGARSFGSAPAFGASLSSSGKGHQSSSIFGGSSNNAPPAQGLPTTNRSVPSEGNQSSSSVFGRAAPLPPPPQHVGGAPRNDGNSNASSVPASGSIPPSQHRQLFFGVPSTVSSVTPAAPSTADPGNAFGAASHDSVLSTGPHAANYAGVRTSSSQGSVLGAAFVGGESAGKAAQPFFASPPSRPPLSTSLSPQHSASTAVPAVGGNAGHGANSSNGGVAGDANTQAAPPPFGAPQTPSFSTTSAPPPQPKSAFTTTAASSPPMNTVDEGGSILGSFSTWGRAASKTAFAAPAPTTPQSPATSSFATTGATVAQPPPPTAIHSAFSAGTKPPVVKASSAFSPDTNESQPRRTATSAFAASAGAAFSTISDPSKSVLGTATVQSAHSFRTAPLATGASDRHPRPADGPASAVAPLPSAQGGRGGAGAAGDGGHRGRSRDGGRRGRRRGRSPSPSESADGPRPGAEGRAAPPPPSSAQPFHFSIPAPRHAQQQQMQRPAAVSRPERLVLPSLPPDEKQWSLATRVCKSFLLQLVSAAAMGAPSSSAGRETGAAEALEQAFFGVAGREGVAGDFSSCAGEMLAVWQAHVRPIVAGSKVPGSAAPPFPGETWVALFALGTYLNAIVSALASPGSSTLTSARADLAAYKAALRDHPVEALTDACHYANELSELLQTLFQRGGEAEAPPYSVLPVVLRRVRTVFDEANARGVVTVQSNLNVVTSKLFAMLNRRVKATAVQALGSTADKPPRWLLTFDSKEKESLLHSFAHLVSEMIAADAPVNEDVELFTAAFHECLPSALAERCMLYYRRACALLRQPLRMRQVEEVAELLAKALAVYPPDAPASNRRVLEVKLLTAELALGRLPSDRDRIALDAPQLIDVVNALKTSRLDLLDAALKMHGPFFVQIGVRNVLMLARQRVALLMVVKYYMAHGCENRLHVAEMVRYHRLPYSSAEAGMVWLLPLLVEKCMNGVLDHEYLILSGKAPFEEYPRELLASAAEPR
ncbi:hypothetical protein ABL78_3967 [Leptomonas seymouri]|uniref:PCI domain-containing protein n=1 Tax=Leptomonas seymouri TaxID=5684 RepID=A0A0N0P5X5_LEPSE|nr:hypothetical protein ABL78_3967 [Leptomonas seymouri]|eukprot:KPI86976.1 hypothetical protein ABL78_3967 [Leptomonas seymouri]